jgi:DNA-binding transcriptional MocR family regulator
VARRRAPHGIVYARVLRDTRLSAQARLLYALLTTFADAGGTAYPSVARLNTDMGVSDRTRRRAQDELEAVGFLEVVEQFHPSGRQAVNLYILNDVPTPAPAPGSDPGARAGVESVDNPESVDTRAGVTPAPVPGSITPAPVPGLNNHQELGVDELVRVRGLAAVRGVLATRQEARA